MGQKKISSFIKLKLLNQMKSEKIDYEEKWEPKYPYLGKLDKIVVLFTESKTGMVVFTEDDIHKIGEYGDGWNEHLFRKHLGKITLSNE